MQAQIEEGETVIHLESGMGLENTDRDFSNSISIRGGA